MTQLDQSLDSRGDELAAMGLSESKLRTYIKAVCTWRRLPESVRAELGVTHLRRLGLVSDPLARAQLAHEPATQRWGVLRLNKAIDIRRVQQDYPKGRKVSNAEIATINLVPDDFHEEWNYTIRPYEQIGASTGAPD